MLERILPSGLYSVLSSLLFLTPLNGSLSILLLVVLFSLLPSTPTIPVYPLPATPNLGYNYRPLHHPKSTKWEKFTPEQLAKFDGKQPGEQDGGRILFAIRRKVYDVTAGKSFYGPGGSYEIFAGRDASRGLAKQSFEPDMLTPLDQEIDTLEDLTKTEWDNLLGWETHFQTKYFQCGDYIEAK
ncbi:cytochrome b5-like heme/steroid binding domain-containing protein [Sporobolomyces salmoneus]|uniref:cytochrome b5-like heme/steroid binding domain-containing protein n=1 Tax=Sporobolomyces salmoneus TaxID=183962 RepID=UPI00317107E0